MSRIASVRKRHAVTTVCVGVGVCVWVWVWVWVGLKQQVALQRTHRSFSDGAEPLGNALTALTSAASSAVHHSTSSPAASPLSFTCTSLNESNRVVAAASTCQNDE